MDKQPPKINTQSYGPETYLSYIKSIALEVERRVRNQTPASPVEFWRIFDEEIDRGFNRMKTTSGIFWHLYHTDSEI